MSKSDSSRVKFIVDDKYKGIIREALSKIDFDKPPSLRLRKQAQFLSSAFTHCLSRRQVKKEKHNESI